ncbi:MAG TPA: leucyl/phenylalanyl-tRNA--protein transferase [Candidatus Tenderia sp.]|nr:leucyl/phenylalanyl-tRNA--protein transferase [Candidatus Tenderia sp.]
MPAPYWLDSHDDVTQFPPVELALNEPNGLLAVGGDLSPARLIAAYRQSIFPWYSEDQPILWWSPNPRAVLFPEALHVSRSLRKIIRQKRFNITFDQDFEGVMTACAEPRSYEQETWISPEIFEAYVALHRLGHAHSVEAWQDDKLVGGLYGVAIGRIFFGESMFSREPNASKVAFVHLTSQLQRWHYRAIDCQVSSKHLHSLGAIDIPRADFLSLLKHHRDLPGRPSPWRFDQDINPLPTQ